MKTTLKEITPEWAARILETRNPSNRKFKPGKISQYASDMRAGRWGLTHQGIAFDVNGDLLDGQNRLAAIVESKVPVKMLVTSGMPRTLKSNGHNISVFSLLDGGAGRRASDALYINGHKNARSVASIAAGVYRMVMGNGFSAKPISTPVIEETVRLLKGSADTIATTHNGTKIVNIRCNGLAAFAFWHTTKSKQAVELLIEALTVTGKANSPSRGLAKWFSKNPRGGGDGASVDAMICASAIYHSAYGHEVQKLFGSESAIKWLLNTNPLLAKSIQAL